MINKNILNGLFGVASIILLVLSVLTYDRIQTFQEYTNIIDKSNKTLITLSTIESKFHEIQVDQRGYLLTKDSAYFKEFQVDKDSLRHAIDYFRKLSLKSHITGDKLNALSEISDKRIHSLLVEIINDSSSAKYKDNQLSLILSNEEINRSFNTLLQEIQSKEKEFLAEKLLRKEFEEQFTPIFIFLLALGSLGFLSYAFYFIYGELNKRIHTSMLLEEKVLALDRSNKELEQYAYVASHDLQEPLRKLRLFSERLGSQYKDLLDENGQYIIERMNAAAEKMTNLIRDLLSLSKLSSEMPTFQEVDLNEVINEVIDGYDEIIATEKIEVNVDNLPFILGNKGQITQLFQNLIGNSIKFRRLQIPTKITIKGHEISRDFQHQEKLFLEVTIEDNGKGFDNKFKEKMFTIFGRLEKTAGVEGTGIGLSICQQILQNHGGFIEADGEPNVGAKFSLFFPVI